MREPTAGSTVVRRPDVQKLPDGTRVELNAGTEFVVEFTPGVRAVRLVRGEALFAVPKNPARPFVVGAGAVSVRAVGTAFAVRHGAAVVGVLVTEGRIAVERTGGDVVSETGVSVPLFVSACGKAEMPSDVSRVPLLAAEIGRALV
jgi:ferric-dicitrate binding protein FerR (iron transport regulator)